MTDYTVTTDDSEDAALAWMAQNSTAAISPPVPAPTPEQYFDSAVHQMLEGYERQYATVMTPAPVQDVATAYVKATPEQQQQVIDILGVPATPA